MASYNEATNIQLGRLGDILFGPEKKAKLKEHGIDTTRAIYELSSPTTQCSAITGIRDPNKTPCYICGIDIDEGDKEIKRGKTINQGLTSECEHILPIAQAILFLGLYWAKAPKNGLFVPKANILKLEYAWAHRTCNQVKSDNTYITIDKTTNKYIVKSDSINDLLVSIYKNKREDSVKFNQILKGKYDKITKFTDARIMPVTSKFQEICDYLNKFQAPELLTLVGAAQIMEGQLHPTAKTILDTDTSEKYNTTGINMITKVAKLSDMFDNIKSETVSLVPPTLPTYRDMIISECDTNENIYLRFLASIPDDLLKFAKPFLKITFLNRLTSQLQQDNKRQYVAVSKISANLLTKTSEISQNEIQRLTNIALTNDIPLTKPYIMKSNNKSNKNRLSGKKRKREETTNDPRKQAELNQNKNNNNMSGGRRKTRKNKN